MFSMYLGLDSNSWRGGLWTLSTLATLIDHQWVKIYPHSFGARGSILVFTFAPGPRMIASLTVAEIWTNISPCKASGQKAKEYIFMQVHYRPTNVHTPLTRCHPNFSS
jgi:hypothetical protein